MGIPALLGLASFGPEMLKGLIDGPGEGCFLWTIAEDSVEWSAKTLKSLGYDPADGAHYDLAQIVGDDELDWLKNSMERRIDDPPAPIRKIKLRASNGETCPFLLQGHWLYQNTDSASHFIGFLRADHGTDEQEVLERKLQRVSSLFKSFLENAPIVAFIKDAQSRKVYVNQFAADLVDAENGEIPYQLAEDMFDEDTVKSLRDTDLQVLEQQEVVRHECWLNFKNGESRYVLDTKFPIALDAEGAPGIGCISIDLTDQKIAEEKLAQAQKMEALGQLVSGIAHDFNNTLAILQGNLELLQGFGSKVDLGEAVSEMLLAVERGSLLTEQLLAFGRKAVLKPVALDLARHIEANTLVLIRKVFPATIAVSLKASESLPAVMVDPNALDNALLNLALNARDAMEGAGQFAIELCKGSPSGSYRDARAFVRLSLSDTGVGIPEDNLERIFEPFFTTKDVSSGTGMGLSMVHGFVSQAGGHIEVSSREGAGARIDLFFPVAENASEVARKTEQASGTSRQSGAVLLVEDDDLVRATLCRQLKALGLTVTAVASGDRAYEELIDRACDFDVMLTDMMMPGAYRGDQLIEAARKQCPDIGVVLISGYPLAGETALENVAFLTKPVSMVDLRKAIGEVRGAG